MQIFNFLNTRVFSLLFILSTFWSPLVSYGQTPPSAPSNEWDINCDFEDDQLFSRYRKISVGPLQTDLELSCATISDLIGSLNRGASDLKNHFVFPEGLKLIIIESDRKLASYRLLTRELTITSEYLNAIEVNPGEFKLLVGVLWHEFGHGLFFENFAPGELRDSMKEFSRTMNLANAADLVNQDSRKKYFDAQSELDSMKSTAPGGFSATEIEDKEAEVDELKASWLKAMKTFSDLSRSATKLVPRINALRSFVSPFNELFGDLIAVGMTDDLEVIKNALWRDDASDEEKEAYVQRSFSLVENRLDKWSPSSVDEYNVLAPARFYLGTQLKGKSSSERVDEIVNSFHVISHFSETEIQSQESGVKPSVDEPINLNTRLIKKLEER